LDEYKGDAQGAIAALTKLQQGEATAALHHEAVGDIDLIWGEEGTGKSDGYGLAKLVKYHGEVLGDLQNILNDMEVVTRSDNRIRLESEKHKAAISLDYKGQSKTWLLTAYEKRDARSTTDTTMDTASSKGVGDTARHSSASSNIVAQKIAQFYNKRPQNNAHAVLQELGTGEHGKFVQRLIDIGKLRVVATKDSTAPAGVQGWTADNGTITLVTDEIAAGQAQAVLLHEMVHQGVKPLVGDRAWGKLMNRLNLLYRQFEDPANKGANRFFVQAHQRVKQAQSKTGKMSDALSREEFAAYAVEEYEQSPQAVKSWVSDMLGEFKAWILRRFGKQFGDVTPQQLRALAVAALKAQGQETGGKYPAPVRFSLGEGKNIAPVRPTREATNFAQARQAAQEFQGKILTNSSSGLKAVVSRNNLDKMLSGSAVRKSETPAAHSLAVANVDRLFEIAVYGWNKEDAKGQGGIRKIHRLFAPMTMPDGKILLTKLTVKETVRPEQNNVLYTVEAVEIEESPASKWVESEITADKPALMSILYAGDDTNIAQSTLKSNIESVMQLAEQVEAHNKSLAERNKDNRKYSIADGAREKMAQVTPARVVQELNGKLTDLKPYVLKTIPLNYFSELKRPNMSAVDGYLKTKRDLDAYRGKKHAQADTIAQKWLKLGKTGKQNIQNLSDLMHESTLKGIDPSKTDAETKAKTGYDALRKKFNQLPPIAQQLYQEVRDSYKTQAKELDDIIPRKAAS